MPDDPKEKAARAAEIQKAVEEADRRKRDDSANDPGKERSGGSSEGVGLDKFLDALNVMERKLDDACARMDELEARDAKKKADAKKRDDDHKRDDDERREGETEEEYEARCMREGRSPASPPEVVADSTDPEYRHRC